jgi:NAD(P)-dependent dehydrogenase (short-subunit alcohol dehydrogenase family)
MPDTAAANTRRIEGTPFHGQHAVVTGGSRGIGAAVAAELSRLGATVTTMSRSGTPPAIRADVRDPDSVASAFEAAVRRNGPIHILVNNAGAAGSAPFARMALSHWREMIDVNLNSTFLCSRAVVPAMTKARYGRIVNVASITGLKGAAYIAAYTAAKHGVIGLTRALAVELAPVGITVNAVCPSYTETDLLSNAVGNIVVKTGRSAEDVRKELLAKNPLGRFITPEEVAEAVVWLALPSSASLTGLAIPIAGGEVT